jgi:predicted TIM-barrel fold metal-dependent hydrolase
MTVVDTHVHYWAEATPDRPHDPEGIHWGAAVTAVMLLERAAAAGVDRIVQVTPALMGFDNRYGIEAALRHPDRIAGVFGRFDVLAPDVEGRLRELMSQPKMLGIRVTLHQPPFEPFLTAAERQGVRVQLFVPYQARELLATARRYDGIRFMVDHMGVRRMSGEPPDRFADWPNLIALAREPNVWIKVSYFPEAAPDHERYPFPTSLRRFRALYEATGSERMIWGSNYPPSARACTYRQSVTFIEEAATFLSAADRRAILGENFSRYVR